MGQAEPISQLASLSRETPQRTVRLARVILQVDAFVDDGEQLMPLDLAQPLIIAAGDWPKFDLDALRASLQRQVDGQAEV